MKTALITGSSKGLGEQLAYALAERGYGIILHGRNQSDLERVRTTIAKKVPCQYIPGDITKKLTIDTLTSIGISNNITILVNNAGMYLKKPSDQLTEEELRRAMEVNFFAPVNLIKALFPHLKSQGRGVIANVNSLAGMVGSDGESAYNASKFALRGFSQSLRFDAVKAGLRVIDFSPGAINTGMVSGRKDPEKCISPEEAADFIASTCVSQLGYKTMRIDEVSMGRVKY